MNVQVNLRFEKFRSSYPDMFHKIALLKIFGTFTEKHPWWSPISEKLQAEDYNMTTEVTHTSDSFSWLIHACLHCENLDV